MTWTPARGDACVEVRHSVQPGKPDRARDATTVRQVTETLVITDDGERYNREGLYPISEGRYSSRKLYPPYADRVLCAEGVRALEYIATLASNLATLDWRDPDALVEALNDLSFATRKECRDVAVTISDARNRKEQP